ILESGRSTRIRWRTTRRARGWRWPRWRSGSRPTWGTSRHSHSGVRARARFFFLLDGLQVGGAAERPHLTEYPVAPLEYVCRRPVGMHADRIRQYRSQYRCFARGQMCRGFMIEAVRRRFHAVNAFAQLHDVEIDLEDALLRPRQLNEHGHPG